jgi:hypothetical protein
MSVLSFPRIYFKGYLGWDPCTFNNNDFMPTYDAANAALNWSFLQTQGQVPPGITPGNFTTTFRPWGIALQTPSGSGPLIPAEWNMFGTHDVAFVQHNQYTTKVIGGETGYGVPVTSDGLIGGAVSIKGDNGQGKGKLVDTNPVSFWSSQVYFDQLSFGSTDCMISGTPTMRIHSRWLDLSRIYTQDHVLSQPAAGVGCCFQAGIPYDQITWPAAGCSGLAAKLQQAASQAPAQGIMVRFTAYVNVYFKNGILNDNTAQAPRNYTELAELLANAWEAWNNNNGDTSLFFSQPCYSHIVGVVGVWNEGELATAPGGRYLSGLNAVAPPAVTGAPSSAPPATPQTYTPTHQVKEVQISGTAPPPTTFLGPIVAEVDYSAKLISLDLNSTMPENGIPGTWPSDLSKTNFGPLVLGVVGSNGAFTAITKIDYTQYSQLPYEAKAGIIDIPFPDSGTGTLLQNGLIALQVQNQIALQEQSFTAQTDTRGIYLDQGGQTQFSITARAQGAVKPGINVLIAKYDDGLNLIPSNQTQFVNFTSGNQQTITSNGITTEVTIVTADNTGNATVGIAAQSPGFPVLAFFPYTGTTLPQPPPTLLPNPPTPPLITYAYYTTVRVLPFDNNVPQTFCDFWNSQPQPTSQQAWDFVYNNILYVYDMLFSVMLEFVNLGSQTGSPKSFDNNLCSIWNLIQADLAQDSTRAMPITRDLSAGKRLTLQLYIYLAYNNFNLGGQPLTVNSIPAGWTPCGKKAAFGNTTKT